MDQDIITVVGDDYSYSFSRGLLAHSLESRGLSLEEAYKLAKEIRSELLDKGISKINENELRRFVRDKAVESVGKEIAYQYNIIEKWHNRNFPLVILIAAARGTDASNIARTLAEKLAIPRVASTSTVSEIMRRLMARDLSPELHEKSYLAWRELRPIYSVLYDEVLVGFEEHAKYPAEAVEGLVQRVLQEGISAVIHGEHLVPRFISKEITSNPNVLFFTLSVNNKEEHENTYLSMYKESRHEKKREHFKAVRKIHDYLVEESVMRSLTVIEHKTVNNTIDLIYKFVLDRLAHLIEDRSYDEYKKIDPDKLHS